MDCKGAEELFSESVEGTLAGARRAELDEHLARCPACRTLRDTVREVRAILMETPAVDAPADLVERVVEFSSRRRKGTSARSRIGLAWSRRLRLAAAAVLLLSGLASLLPNNPVSRSVDSRRLATRAVNLGMQLAEKKDRLVEDLRMLKALASTALQGRVERVNESVDDYRKLLEQRRSGQPSDRKSGTFFERNRPSIRRT